MAGRQVSRGQREHLGEVQVGELEPEFSDAHARSVEQVFHQPGHVHDLALDDLLLSGEGQVVGAQAAEQFGGHLDRPERIAQLVRHHRQEVDLAAMRRVGPHAQRIRVEDGEHQAFVGFAQVLRPGSWASAGCGPRDRATGPSRKQIQALPPQDRFRRETRNRPGPRFFDRYMAASASAISDFRVVRVLRPDWRCPRSPSDTACGCPPGRARPPRPASARR